MQQLWALREENMITIRIIWLYMGEQFCQELTSKAGPSFPAVGDEIEWRDGDLIWLLQVELRRWLAWAKVLELHCICMERRGDSS